MPFSSRTSRIVSSPITYFSLFIVIVPFGKKEMDPIEWVCCLSAINKETHLKAMFQLVNLFYNQSFRKQIKECKTGEEIYKIIEQFEYETR